tara:strand:- start:204 stop:461 length:258 start_codon:yes stop_codon:yes gene_type:complete
MKGTRLKDVLDDKPLDKTKWDIIFGKLKKLGTAIEMHFGDRMNIDHSEYRWVQDRIEYYEVKGRLLTKDEMQTANDMWNRYGPQR